MDPLSPLQGHCARGDELLRRHVSGRLTLQIMRYCRRCADWRRRRCRRPDTGDARASSRCRDGGMLMASDYPARHVRRPQTGVSASCYVAETARRRPRAIFGGWPTAAQ